jgi:hypothetical protein
MRATYTTSEVAVIAYLVTVPQTKRNFEKCFGNFVFFLYVGAEKNWRLDDKVHMTRAV